MERNFYVSLFVFSVFLVQFGSSIICYDCNSAYDPRCGDNFDPFSLGVVNCSLRDRLEHMPDAEPKVCRSIKMEIYGKVRVVRSCGYITDSIVDDQTCSRKSSSDKLFVTYCSCTQDLCNGGFTGNLDLFVCLFALVVFMLK